MKWYSTMPPIPTSKFGAVKSGRLDRLRERYSGKQYRYTADRRVGTVRDVSLCGNWLFLERHDVRPGEHEWTAVWLKDPDLQEVMS